MSRMKPNDLDRLKVRIAAVIEHVESKSLQRDTLRDLLRVGEIKVCVENICEFVADYEVDLDPAYRRELIACCQTLGVDESYYLK